MVKDGLLKNFILHTFYEKEWKHVEQQSFEGGSVIIS